MVSPIEHKPLREYSPDFPFQKANLLLFQTQGIHALHGFLREIVVLFPAKGTEFLPSSHLRMKKAIWCHAKYQGLKIKKLTPSTGLLGCDLGPITLLSSPQFLHLFFEPNQLCKLQNSGITKLVWKVAVMTSISAAPRKSAFYPLLLSKPTQLQKEQAQASATVLGRQHLVRVHMMASPGQVI